MVSMSTAAVNKDGPRNTPAAASIKAVGHKLSTKPLRKTSRKKYRAPDVPPLNVRSQNVVQVAEVCPSPALSQQKPPAVGGVNSDPVVPVASPVKAKSCADLSRSDSLHVNALENAARPDRMVRAASRCGNLKLTSKAKAPPPPRLVQDSQDPTNTATSSQPKDSQIQDCRNEDVHVVSPDCVVGDSTGENSTVAAPAIKLDLPDTTSSAEPSVNRKTVVSGQKPLSKCLSLVTAPPRPSRTRRCVSALPNSNFPRSPAELDVEPDFGGLEDTGISVETTDEAEQMTAEEVGGAIRQTGKVQITPTSIVGEDRGRMDPAAAVTAGGNTQSDMETLGEGALNSVGTQTPEDAHWSDLSEDENGAVGSSRNAAEEMRECGVSNKEALSDKNDKTAGENQEGIEMESKQQDRTEKIPDLCELDETDFIRVKQKAADVLTNDHSEKPVKNPEIIEDPEISGETSGKIGGNIELPKYADHSTSLLSTVNSSCQLSSSSAEQQTEGRREEAVGIIKIEKRSTKAMTGPLKGAPNSAPSTIQRKQSNKTASPLIFKFQTYQDRRVTKTATKQLTTEQTTEGSASRVATERKPSTWDDSDADNLRKVSDDRGQPVRRAESVYTPDWRGSVPVNVHLSSYADKTNAAKYRNQFPSAGRRCFTLQRSTSVVQPSPVVVNGLNRIFSSRQSLFNGPAAVLNNSSGKTAVSPASARTSNDVTGTSHSLSTASSETTERELSGCKPSSPPLKMVAPPKVITETMTTVKKKPQIPPKPISPVPSVSGSSHSHKHQTLGVAEEKTLIKLAPLKSSSPSHHLPLTPLVSWSSLKKKSPVCDSSVCDGDVGSKDVDNLDPVCMPLKQRMAWLKNNEHLILKRRSP